MVLIRRLEVAASAGAPAIPASPLCNPCGTITNNGQVHVVTCARVLIYTQVRTVEQLIHVRRARVAFDAEVAHFGTVSSQEDLLTPGELPTTAAVLVRVNDGINVPPQVPALPTILRDPQVGDTVVIAARARSVAGQVLAVGQEIESNVQNLTRLSDCFTVSPPATGAFRDEDSGAPVLSPDGTAWLGMLLYQKNGVVCCSKARNIVRLL